MDFTLFKKVPLKLVLVVHIPEPEKMEFGVVYYSKEFNIQNHLCVCGCGMQTPFQIGHGEWSLSTQGDKFSISPSILQLGGCKSHYIITNSIANII
jgi:hypothetical protein